MLAAQIVMPLLWSEASSAESIYITSTEFTSTEYRVEVALASALR
jgi:hypothetical protein